MGLGFLVGVVALGAILVYLAFVGVWWAEGYLSLLGVVAIGFTALGVVSVGHMGLILTGFDSVRAPPDLNRLLRHGRTCLTFMVLFGMLVPAFWDKLIVAGVFALLAVLTNLLGLVLSGIGTWQAWRAGQPGKASGIALLAWGLMPWLLAVFYFA